MKQLKKFILNDVECTELTEKQMKSIVGGANQEKLCDSTCTGSCTVSIFNVYTTGTCSYTPVKDSSGNETLVCGCKIYGK